MSAFFAQATRSPRLVWCPPACMMPSRANSFRVPRSQRLRCRRFAPYNPDARVPRLSSLSPLQLLTLWYGARMSCMGFLNHKYLYQGYPMDILFQFSRGPCRLGSLAVPSGPGHHGPLRAILYHCDVPQHCRSSVSATDRPPPRRGLPRPNCHNHLLISYTWLPRGLPARLVGCICKPMWKPGAPVLAELMWDWSTGWCFQYAYSNHTLSAGADPIRRSQNMKGIRKV